MNLWADKKKARPLSTPIKVIDIELSSPLPPLDGLGDYVRLQALVRLHGRPLGYIERPVIAGRCSGPDLRKAILAEHSGAILRQLLLDQLGAPLGSDGVRIEDLFQGTNSFDNPEKLPLVTVAVCTRDREHYLPLCLDALSRLEYPHLDLLVVDNAPRNDGTERLVRKMYPHLRYIREPRPGLNWARNRAIFEARGRIIAYADDDVAVDAGWAKALADDFIENPEIMAVTGLVVPYELETEAQVLFERYCGFGRGFERRWYPTDLCNGRPMARLYSFAGQFGTGANMAFRRSLFDQINHFDPALDYGTATHGGGDLEIFFRVIKEGGALLYEPGAIVRHRHRRSHSELRIQLGKWAIGFGSYLMRSALAYPDERSTFLRKGLWWLWQMNIRRPMRCSLDPLHVPWNLILAEACGSWMGPLCYLAARYTASRIEEIFGPLSQTPMGGSFEYAKDRKKFGKNIGTFQVDLDQPLPVLSEAVDYGSVRIFAVWKGRRLGSFEIPNYYKSITPRRLREAVVDHLGLRLMDPDCKKSLDDLRAEIYAALWRYYISSAKGL